MATPVRKKPGSRTSKRACDFCKYRHLKCDGREPCGHCDHRSISCHYSQELPQAQEDSTYRSDNLDRPVITSADLAPRPLKMPKLSEPAGYFLVNDNGHLTHEHDRNTYREYYQMPQFGQSFDSRPQQLAHGAGFPDYPGMPQHVPPHVTSPAPPPGFPVHPRDAYFNVPHMQNTENIIPPRQNVPMFPAPSTQVPVPVPGPTVLPAPHPPAPDASLPTVSPTAPEDTPKPKNNLILNYTKSVQPISSAQIPTIDAANLQVLLQTERARIASIDTLTLVKAFNECAMVAHGSRHNGNPALGQKYAEKAFQIFMLLINSRQHNPEFEEHIQQIVVGLELLVLFLVGSDDGVRCRQLTTEAYRLLHTFRPKISTATAHRIYVLQIGSSATNDDALFYMRKIVDVNLEEDPDYAVSGLIILCLTMMVRPFTRSDMSPVSPQIPTISEGDSAFFNLALDYLNKADEAVSGLESRSVGDADKTHLASVFRYVLIGMRAVLYWQMGYVAKAATEAVKVVQGGKTTPVCRLAHALSFAYCLQILRFAGQSETFTRGLADLEQDCTYYSMITRMLEELKQPVPADKFNMAPLSPMNSSSATTSPGTSVHSSGKSPLHVKKEFVSPLGSGAPSPHPPENPPAAVSIQQQHQQHQPHQPHHQQQQQQQQQPNVNPPEGPGGVSLVLQIQAQVMPHRHTQNQEHQHQQQRFPPSGGAEQHGMPTADYAQQQQQYRTPERTGVAPHETFTPNFSYAAACGPSDSLVFSLPPSQAEIESGQFFEASPFWSSFV